MRDTAAATGFSWGGFVARWAACVAALTGLATGAFLLVHQYLAAWTRPDVLASHRTQDALVEQARALVRPWVVLLDPAWATWALLAGLPFAAFVYAGWRVRSLMEAGGPRIAESLGGEPLHEASKDPARLALLARVAAQAAARNVAAPPVYLLARLEGACAATFGSGARDAAIVVGRGALRLDPPALDALVAWQLAALDDDRLARDTRIAGFLAPFVVLWSLGDAMLRLERALDAQLGTLVSLSAALAGTAKTVRLMLRFAGLPALAMGRWLSRHALAADVLRRDAEVVARIGRADALAALLWRATPEFVRPTDLEAQEELFAAEAESVTLAHAFCVEPVSVPSSPRLSALAARLASHPDPGTRIERIAAQFDFTGYEQRQHAEAAPAPIPGTARGATAQAAVRTRLQGPPSDPAEDGARTEFFLRFDRATLARLADAAGASHWLLAAIAPAASEHEALRTALQGLGWKQRRWAIERALAVLAAADESTRLAHLKAHRALIEADRRITLDELADWLFVERALAPPAAAVEAATEADARTLLALFAWSGARDEAAAHKAYAAGLSAFGTPADATLPARGTLGGDAIEQAVRRLGGTADALRLRTLRACAAACRSDGRVSEVEDELLRRLCYVLDAPHAALAAATATPTPRATDERRHHEPPAGSTALDARGYSGVQAGGACERCQGRRELRRYPRAAGDIAADWFLPVVASLVACGVFLWSSPPHRSPHAGAWLIAIGACVLITLLVFFIYSLWNPDALAVEVPRGLGIGVLAVLVAGGVLLALLARASPGELVGGLLFGASMIAGVAFAPRRLPASAFYFCRGCGLLTGARREAPAADRD